MYVRSILSCVRLAPFAAAIVVAGCGGSGGTAANERVRGPGFTFDAPAGFVVARTPSSATVRPDGGGGVELASVTRFPLVKPFKPSLWPKAKGELDGVASRLAMGLVAKQTEPAKTVRLGSVQSPGAGALMGRRYVMTFQQNGTDVTQRLTLLLDRKTEFQLLCRWATSSGEPESCGLLESTFVPARR